MTVRSWLRDKKAIAVFYFQAGKLARQERDRKKKRLEDERRTN